MAGEYSGTQKYIRKHIKTSFILDYFTFSLLYCFAGFNKPFSKTFKNRTYYKCTHNLNTHKNTHSLMLKAKRITRLQNCSQEHPNVLVEH